MREVPSIVIPSTSEQFTRMPDIFCEDMYFVLRRRKLTASSSGIVAHTYTSYCDGIIPSLNLKA